MRGISAIGLVSLLLTANAFAPHHVQQPLSSIKSTVSSTTYLPFKSRSSSVKYNFGVHESFAHLNNVNYSTSTSALNADAVAYRLDGSCDPFDPESTEFCTTDAAEIDGSMNRSIRLTVLFALWYILNIGYNIGNKSVLNALPLPWTAATVELFFGFPYVLFLWGTGIRKAPKLSFDNIKTLSSQAFFLAATHVAGVVSFGAGAISFTHIVKATEPVWSALILAGFGEFLPIPVYLSLVPIMGGVAMASMKELSFTWLAFTAGAISAFTSAAKAILSKKVLDGKPLGENLTPANMFAVLTILGFLFILPASLMIEGPAKISVAYKASLAAGYTNAQLLRLLSASGFLYYLYNEVAFMALNEVAPVTHAVANTVKRVVIIIASVLVFRNPVSLQGGIGSAIAILGACLYSVAKSKCKPKPKTA
jgi:solute carrier family 35 protein E1